MTRSFKALTLAGVAVIGLGVMPGIAAAGHDNGYRGKGDRGYGYERSYDDGYRGYKGDKKYRKWHKQQAKRHYYGGHGGKTVVVHKHKHKHKNDNDYLLPVLALGAVGLTAAFLASQSQAAPPPSRERVIWNDPPPPAYVPARAPAQPSGPASTCLMTREYQTQVAVGGKLVEAYGQACLQPDGSWYHGPAQPVLY